MSAASYYYYFCPILETTLASKKKRIQNLTLRCVDLCAVVWIINYLRKKIICVYNHFFCAHACTHAGFDNAVQGCCGTGLFEAGYFCSLSTAMLCGNADKYVFFDAIHPTEKMYKLLADTVINTTLHVFMWNYIYILFHLDTMEKRQAWTRLYMALTTVQVYNLYCTQTPTKSSRYDFDAISYTVCYSTCAVNHVLSIKAMILNTSIYIYIVHIYMRILLWVWPILQFSMYQ